MIYLFEGLCGEDVWEMIKKKQGVIMMVWSRDPRGDLRKDFCRTDKEYGRI